MLIAQGGDIVEIAVQIIRVGVIEEKNHVDLVVGDARANLLTAAMGMGQEQLNGQTGSLSDQISGAVGGADGVLGENAALGNAELYHQFFLFIMAHKGDIH